MVSRRVLESVQLIHIGPNTALTLSQISYICRRAKMNYMYAKFYTDKYFIQANFMRDNTINISTNIKSPGFIAQYRKYEREGWTFGRVVTFIYDWMQTKRRSLE